MRVFGYISLGWHSKALQITSEFGSTTCYKGHVTFKVSYQSEDKVQSNQEERKEKNKIQTTKMRNGPYIKVFLYLDPSVIEEISLFYKSTSVSCLPLMPSIFVVSLNLFFLSFLHKLLRLFQPICLLRHGKFSQDHDTHTCCN